MFLNSVVTVGTEKIIPIAGIFINAAVLVIGYITLKNASKKAIDTRIDAKADKTYVEDITKMLTDKIAQYEAHNTKAHAEMKTDATLAETRNSKQHDDLRADYVRGISAVESTLGKIWQLLLEINKK